MARSWYLYVVERLLLGKEARQNLGEDGFLVPHICFRIILAAALFLIMDGHDDVSKREGTTTRVNLEESGAARDGNDSTIIDALVENLNVDESTMPSDPIVQWTSIPSQHPMLELRVQVNVIDTRLLKEELTRISIWLKLHDVPIQVFEEDGISLIATFIGKYVMLDSNTSSMCNDSWGRSSFARCLIEVNLEADLLTLLLSDFLHLMGDGFTKEKIPLSGKSSIVTTSIVVHLLLRGNDSFETVSKKKKRKGRKLTSTLKKVITNGGNPSTSSSMLKTSGTSSKKDNIPTSNSYSVLNAEEEEEEEDVENVYDESANLSTKTGGRSYFTPAVVDNRRIVITSKLETFAAPNGTVLMHGTWEELQVKVKRVPIIQSELDDFLMTSDIAFIDVCLFT
ncbi:zinc knuckle CX2CX4HX4C containing protein [Tanacetum coccineum]